MIVHVDVRGVGDCMMQSGNKQSVQGHKDYLQVEVLVLVDRMATEDSVATL